MFRVALCMMMDVGDIVRELPGKWGAGRNWRLHTTYRMRDLGSRGLDRTSNTTRREKPMHWLQEARAFLQSLVDAREGAAQTCLLLRYDGVLCDVSIVKIDSNNAVAEGCALCPCHSLPFHRLAQRRPCSVLWHPAALGRDIQTSRALSRAM